MTYVLTLEYMELGPRNLLLLLLQEFCTVMSCCQNIRTFLFQVRQDPLLPSHYLYRVEKVFALPLCITWPPDCSSRRWFLFQMEAVPSLENP